jgi:hypothetical protein
MLVIMLKMPAQLIFICRAVENMIKDVNAPYSIYQPLEEYLTRLTAPLQVAEALLLCYLKRKSNV